MARKKSRCTCVVKHGKCQRRSKVTKGKKRVPSQCKGLKGRSLTQCKRIMQKEYRL